MEIKNIKDLVTLQIQELHNIETQLVTALPMLIEKAQMKELRAGLQQHLEETKVQTKRLEDIGQDMNLTLSGVTDMAMMYMLKSGMNVLSQTTDPSLIDMVIIGSAEKVEHYEMAFYQGVITLAKQGDMKDIADVLNKSLGEEKAAAQKLSLLAGGGLGKAVASIM